MHVCCTIAAASLPHNSTGVLGAGRTGGRATRKGKTLSGMLGSAMAWVRFAGGARGEAKVVARIRRFRFALHLDAQQYPGEVDTDQQRDSEEDEDQPIGHRMPMCSKNR
jgi:hypothetical protein